MTIQEIYLAVDKLIYDDLIEKLTAINEGVESLSENYDREVDFITMNNLLLRQSRIKALIDLKETL